MRIWIIPALMMIFLSSCTSSLSYFTEDLREKEKWTQNEIEKIQFYTSSDIVLTRFLNDGETSIVGGKIIMKNGKKTERVLIPRGTPGVMVFMPRENRLGISFEEKGSDAYLMFGPNPKINNRYALLAQDWSRSEGKVHYHGNVYNVDSESAFASLLVDLSSIGKSESKTRTVSGRKVGN